MPPLMRVLEDSALIFATLKRPMWMLMPPAFLNFEFIRTSGAYSSRIGRG